MSNNSKRNPTWSLDPPASQVVDYFRTNPKHTKYVYNYETDVTQNPFRHNIHGRIAPLKGKYKDKYRWKKDDLRIVYLPNKETHTIATLDVDTAGNVRYKKRS